MSRSKKIFNKIHTQYLSLFQSIFIAKGAWIDYRCEIVNKRSISIGKKSILYKHVTIYKKDKGQFTLGNESHIAPYGYFLIDKYNIFIGNAVVIGKNCSFFCVSNTVSLNNKLFKDCYTQGDISVGDNVFIGANCVILPKTMIGDNVVIASNSTVKGKLESGYMYGGNPTRKIKKVYDV